MHKILLVFYLIPLSLIPLAYTQNAFEESGRIFYLSSLSWCLIEKYESTEWTDSTPCLVGRIEQFCFLFDCRIKIERSGHVLCLVQELN
jgi:hypothetical protein